MNRKFQIFFFVPALWILLFFGISGCGVDREFKDAVRSMRDTVLEERARAAKEELFAENQNETAGFPVESDTDDSAADDRIFERILNSCTGEFIGYHTLDESFLAWFAAEYGRDALQRIAGEVQSPNQDVNLWHELTGNTIRVLWLLYCRQTGVQPYQLERVAWQSCAKETEAALAFSGDINFSEGYATTKHMDKSPNGILDCFSPDLLTLMNGMDVMMLNNEFTYSRRGKALEGKAFTFRADPDRAELLSVFGTDIVGLANNHTYDFGPDALCDTLDTLDGISMPYVGAGRNLEEAKRPYYFILNGRKIAIVAATQIERSLNYTKEATEDSPGVLKTLNADKFVQVISGAKKNSDIVIVFVHWGTEGDSNYGRDQRALAEQFVQAGADAIIGGHTHCLQGFDWIDGVPVVYSLGNFWFGRSTQDTGLAEISIDEAGGLTLRFIPCIQKNIRTQLVTEEEEKQRIFAFLRKHSAKGVTLTEEGIVQKVQ